MFKEVSQGPLHDGSAGAGEGSEAAGLGYCEVNCGMRFPGAPDTVLSIFQAGLRKEEARIHAEFVRRIHSLERQIGSHDTSPESYRELAKCYR